MKNTHFIILLFIVVNCLFGCGKTYYVNFMHGDRNFQTDNAICSAYAYSRTPAVPVMLQGDVNATTHGHINIMTPNGMYTGVYTQNTTYEDTMATYKSLAALSATLGASIHEANLYNLCLNSLGWQKATKELHDRVIAGDIPVINFTTEKYGADIYAVDKNTGAVVKLAKKAPSKISTPAQYWVPECYRAEYDGEPSETVCFDTNDKVRNVHFRWIGEKTHKNSSRKKSKRN